MTTKTPPNHRGAGDVELSRGDKHPAVLDGVIMCGPRPPSEEDLAAVREFGMWLDLRARKRRARERGDREEAGCQAEGLSARNPDHLHICTGPEDHPAEDGHACVCGDWWHDR